MDGLLVTTRLLSVSAGRTASVMLRGRKHYQWLSFRPQPHPFASKSNFHLNSILSWHFRLCTTWKGKDKEEAESTSVKHKLKRYTRIQSDPIRRQCAAPDFLSSIFLSRFGRKFFPRSLSSSRTWKWHVMTELISSAFVRPQRLLSKRWKAKLYKDKSAGWGASRANNNAGDIQSRMLSHWRRPGTRVTFSIVVFVSRLT